MRSRFEERFGVSFADVVVHDSKAGARAAASVGARAFAQKNHVVFGAGEYRPHTPRGAHLLAHELAHVAQTGRVGGSSRLWRTVNSSTQRVESVTERLLTISMTVPADHAEFERDVLDGMRRWVAHELLEEPPEQPRTQREVDNGIFREQLRAYFYQLQSFRSLPSVTARIIVRSDEHGVSAYPAPVTEAQEQHGRYHLLITDWADLQSQFDDDPTCNTNCLYIARAVSRYLDSGAVASPGCSEGAYYGSPSATVTSGGALFDHFADSRVSDYSHMHVLGNRPDVRMLMPAGILETPNHGFIVAKIDGIPHLIDADGASAPISTRGGFEAYWAHHRFNEGYLYPPSVTIRMIGARAEPDRDLELRDRDRGE